MITERFLMKMERRNPTMKTSFPKLEKPFSKHLKNSKII